MGLVENRQDIIANIIHYHRKSMPSLEDANFKNLNSRNRNAVTKLSILLRIADALDVSHTGNVKDIKMERQKTAWLLIPHGRGDLALERWTLEKRVKLFQEVFDVKLKVAG
jgi:exopolyphosphatase/guanosine-5'-triphosphate,3'-diphosphate pyrophosphatase